MSSAVSHLASSQAFSSGFTAPQLDLIAGISSEVWFRAGHHLWRQGEVHEICYLVVSGQLALEIYVPMHGPIAVDTVSQGELLGASGLLNSQKWNFDARALSDVRAIAIDCTQLRALAEEDHELGFQVYRSLAQILETRLGTARRRLLELIAPSRG
ncbi:MAG: cyclic nucleotide-binding domain-containing protein [Acidobacteriota bacterium]